MLNIALEIKLPSRSITPRDLLRLRKLVLPFVLQEFSKLLQLEVCHYDGSMIYVNDLC